MLLSNDSELNNNFYYDDNSEFILPNTNSSIDLNDLIEKYNFIMQNSEMSGFYLLSGKLCNGIKCMPLVSKSKNVYDNPKIMSNIIGYFDKLSPQHKFKYKKQGKPLPKITVRETRFVTDYPEKFKKLIPLIKEIDKYYKEYAPEYYAKQKKKANQTPYHIADTAFTTVTTNVNYQTTVHTDKGDDPEGFGNLVVIEHGKYKGGETCFPQYGIGIDARTCDVLYMDVHQPHGNLPVELESNDAKRLSIVCYLRKSIWDQTKGKTRKFMEKHNRTMRNIMKKKD
jgi:hypothetical protein